MVILFFFFSMSSLLLLRLPRELITTEIVKRGLIGEFRGGDADCPLSAIALALTCKQLFTLLFADIKGFVTAHTTAANRSIACDAEWMNWVMLSGSLEQWEWLQQWNWLNPRKQYAFTIHFVPTQSSPDRLALTGMRSEPIAKPSERLLRHFWQTAANDRVHVTRCIMALERGIARLARRDDKVQWFNTFARVHVSASWVCSMRLASRFPRNGLMTLLEKIILPLGLLGFFTRAQWAAILHDSQWEFPGDANPGYLWGHLGKQGCFGKALLKLCGTDPALFTAWIIHFHGLRAGSEWRMVSPLLVQLVRSAIQHHGRTAALVACLAAIVPARRR